MSEDCVFCKIVEGEIPSNKVYETGNWIAFLDNNPVSKGHTLIIPKEHVEDIHEAERMDFMWKGIKKTADAVKQAFNPKGINIDQNNGEVAGQEVFHLHFHITPRYTGDELEVNYDRSKLEEGGKIAEEIRSEIT